MFAPFRGERNDCDAKDKIIKSVANTATIP
jgi:hypothetical protein